MPPSAPIAAVLFDLDGTLVDSAPRIAVALNHALAARGLPALDIGRVASLVGGGPAALVDRALRAIDGDPGKADAVLAEYRIQYLTIKTPPWTLYPGVAVMLDVLAAMRIRRGIVTNTLGAFADMMLGRCGIESRIEAVVSGDASIPLKPHPEPLLRACALLGVTPAQTLVVGDSATDVTAARAAGIRVVCVSYGYNHGQPVRELGCDAVLDDITALPRWIEDSNATSANAAV